MQAPPISRPQALRWTRDEYARMAEIGLLTGRRVQLIDGEIIEMPAMKPPHAVALELVRDALLAIVDPGYRVRQHVPLALGRYSDPEPDAAVVAGEARDFVDGHPTTAVLVIEISDTTLALDQGRKRVIYATAGIPEYWVLDLNARVLHVYRTILPETGEDGAPRATYAEHKELGEEQVIAPLAFPTARIAVRDLLP